jgi:hypothetical protein
LVLFNEYPLPIFSFVGVDGVFTGITLVGGLFDDCAVISPSTPEPAIFFKIKEHLAYENNYGMIKIRRITFFVIDVTAHPAQLSATLAAAPATLLATANDEFSVEFGSGIAVSGCK